MALGINIISTLNDKGLRAAGQQTQTLGDKFKKFGKAAALALAAAAAAVAAFAVKFAKDSIVAAEAMATANARIQQVNESMGLFGKQAQAVTDRLVKLAEATALNTGVDQNAIKMTQAKLLTFKNLAATAGQVGGAFDRATQAAIDLAATGFGSAETNAVQLGKALQDPIKGITALARAGVTFTEVEKQKIKVLVESGKMLEAQEMILAAIETQVGGTAEATANASDKMKVAFSQLQERVGTLLLPAFEKFTNVMISKVFPAIEHNLVPAIQKLWNWLYKELSPAFVWYTDYLQKNVVPILKQLWNAFQTYVIPAIVETYNYLKDKLAKAFQNFRLFIEQNREQIIMFAKVLAVILYAAFKAVIWIVERLADALVTYSENLNKASNFMRKIAPIAQELYNKLKLILTAFSYINPAARLALNGLNALEQGFQNLANTDWSGLGETSAKSWIEGWGVGWNSVSEPVFQDIFTDTTDLFSQSIPAAIKEGTSKLADKMKDYKATLKSKLDEVKDELKSFRDEVRSVIVDAIDFGAAFQEVEDARKLAAENGEEFGGSFLDALLAQAQKASEFAAKIQELIKMGLSKDAISEVLAAGVETGTLIADELIAGGSDTITKTNELVESTKKAAQKVAKFAGDSYYGAGLDTAKKMVAGFKDLIKEGGKGWKELMAAMDKLAKKLAREVKITVKTSTGAPVSGGTSVPELAHGGIISRPTLAIIGEAGPEAVVPLKRGPRNFVPTPETGRGITINVHGALDPEAVARQIENILKRSELRAGAY